VPGKAANRKPGRTVRESAVIPMISRSENPAGAGTGAISSVIFKPLALQAFDHQRPLDFRRSLVDRPDSEKRRDPLNDAAGHRRHRPARSGVAVALLVGVRFVHDRQYQIFRVSDREDPDKARKQLFF